MTTSSAAHLDECESCRVKLLEIQRLANLRSVNSDATTCDHVLLLLSEPDLQALNETTWANLLVHLSECPRCRTVGLSEWMPDTTAEVLQDFSLVAGLPVVSRHYYEHVRKVAEGGMGRVSEYIDRRIDRPVLIKEARITPEMPWQKRHALYARLEREAELTAQLEHPAIVSVYEAGRWSTGAPFFVMRYVDGVPLDQAIQTRSRLTERLKLLPRVIAVADAMSYAHDKGVVHRDLKPHNILVGAFGETVVIDWGLAKEVREESVRTKVPEGRVLESLVLTDRDTALGTPAYMAPEQARAETVDARADVYSLGALLYHLVTGRPPFADDGSLTQIFRRPGINAPAPVRRLTPHAPAALVSIIERAMSTNPDDRYPEARQLAEDLRRLQQGEFVLSHDYSMKEHIELWVSKHTTAVIIGTLAVLLLTGVVMWSFIHIRQSEVQARESAAYARRMQRAADANAVSARKQAEDAQYERRRADEAAQRAERETREVTAAKAALSDQLTVTQRLTETLQRKEKTLLTQKHELEASNVRLERALLSVQKERNNARVLSTELARQLDLEKARTDRWRRLLGPTVEYLPGPLRSRSPSGGGL